MNESAGGLPIRWVWIFLDTPGSPDTAAADNWDFWRRLTRTQLSTRRGADGEFATLLPVAGGGAWVKVQRVGDERGGVHLDLDVPDVQAAARTALDLGAQRIGAIGDTVVILRSPGGFVHCLTTWRAPGEPPVRREGQPDLLDQVCLDIPGTAPEYAAECAYWAALTGWARGRYDEVYGFLQPPPGIPVRLLLQHVGGSGPVRAHVDFASADRPAAVARQVAAGARVEAEHEQWTVLLDPLGRRYCVTHRPVQPR